LRPPLRCSGKDANRTPPESVVPGLPQAGGARSCRRLKPALQRAGEGVSCGRSAARQGERQDGWGRACDSECNGGAYAPRFLG